MWGEVEIIGPPRLDGNLTLTMSGHPSRRGFVMHDDGWWRRPGWRAHEMRGMHGEERTRAIAEAEHLERHGLDISEMEDANVSRIDICCDVTGDAPVCLDLYDFLSGGRGAQSHEESDHGKAMTIYYGGKRSAVKLKIYTKAYAERPPTKWLEEVWGGWDGSLVTRVEFSLSGPAVKGMHASEIKRKLMKLWRDACSRIVLRAKRVTRADPETGRRVKIYAESNKAPESPAWAVIRGGKKETEKRPKNPESLVGIENALLRIIRRHARAGADVKKVMREYETGGMGAGEPDDEKIKKRIKHLEDTAWRLERDADLLRSTSSEDVEDEADET